MVDLAALRSAQPDLLNSAAGDWQALGARLGSQVTALQAEVMEPLFGTGDWTGIAANAASASLDNLSKQLSVTEDYAATMTSLLHDAAGGVRDAQSWLQAAENLAAQNRLTIGADGTVSAAPAPPLVRSGSASLVEAPSPAMGEVADLVGRALTVANDVDAQITARLLELQKFAGASAVSQLHGADRLARSFDQESLPPAGTDPDEVNEWWNALDREQQLRLISEFPSQLGWMNGLPAWARNQANVDVMTAEQQQLRDQLASLEGSEPRQYLGESRWGPEINPAWQQWQGQISAIKTKLAEIASVESGIAYAESKAGAHNVFLLGFNTDGNGHAIVAVGNPDTADNTVTYVPGLGSTLTGASGDIGRATALWGQAERLAPGETISSIYWLGYNAPQLGLNQGLSNFDVASTSDATAGAVSLAHFETGLQAAHQVGIPDHTVVLGHSYGSLVVGEAAAHDSMHPGDIIVVGSPGVGVNQAAQLGLPPAHVWAGENAHDPVPRLPPSDPVTALSDRSAAHFGTNPASKAFGAQIFNADIDPSRSFSGIDLSAHSSYWDPGSSSLLNMAHIVDGQYSSVSIGPQAPPNLESAALGGLF
jgi:Alpha/beta hydrolase